MAVTKVALHQSRSTKAEAPKQRSPAPKQTIDAHLDQGWLGGPQRQLAIKIVQEIEQALARVEQGDIRDLLKVRLNQIGSALSSEHKS